MQPHMQFDFPYPSQRAPVMARNVVATSQPLATQAGIEMLRSGGNAVDAAVASAITLTVVEPTSNGIGSDLFAILWDGQQLHGLNASGRSPACWTRDRFDRMDEMPQRGWNTVTVPGAVSGWVELSRKFGKLPFTQLFEPAIRYARDGFAVTPITARAWGVAFDRLKDFEEWRRVFAPKNRAPLPGEFWQSADHARTLETIATTNGTAFYTGEVADRIVRVATEAGTPWTLADLSSHRCDWVGTMCVDYRGSLLHEIPPNGQGIAALIAAGILSEFDVASHRIDGVDDLHLQIESMKLAFADAYAHVSDLSTMKVDPFAMLDRAYLQSRAKLIDPKRAKTFRAGVPKEGGTVYLCAADASGMMVSLIQSNYQGFGSGVVIPGTGIAMQNRGNGFVLERGHPNEVGPEKRPFHTIIPGFVMRDGSPLMSFGVMGGSMQPQGHLQMLTRIFDRRLNPQSSSDAPRWQVVSGRKVIVEPGFAPQVLDGLRKRGHQIKIGEPREFGGAQVIYRIESGYVAASDHRKDGHAAGF